MKKVEYFCNLCQTKQAKENLKALYWKSDIIPQRYVVDKDVSRSDMHICHECINLIKESTS